MNYETNIKNTYTLDLAPFDSNGSSAYLMLNNGDSYYIEEIPSTPGLKTFEEVVYFYANYSNRHYESYVDLILFYDTNGLYYLLSRNNVDYVVTQSLNSTYTSYLDYTSSDNSLLDNSASVTSYMQYNALDSFTTYTYGDQTISNITNGKRVITDYSNIKANNQYPTYEQYAFPVRGENVTFNKFFNVLSFSSENELIVSYGSPYYDIRQEALETGYSNGYQAGHTNGFNDGYDIGLNSHVDENTYTAFGYIGTAFNAVNGILALEVLPHITLGLCFSIPLVLVLIMTIFRLVKK